MSFLLDTNVISELRKAAPDERVSRWHASTGDADMYLSALAVGEIRYGIERLRGRGDNSQADRLEVWLTQLKTEFADRLVAVTAAIAERWARLMAARPLPIIDGFMTATAIEHDLTLVTRDTEALADTGARLFDPWSG